MAHDPISAVMMNPMRGILWKIYKSALPRLSDGRAKSALDMIDPKIMDGISEIVSRASLSMSHMPYQGLDVAETLTRIKPKKIVELGSGQSSVVFAGYAKKYGAAFVSFEQDEVWRDFSNAGCEVVSGETPVIYSPTRETADGARYSEDIPDGADFIYMDGPYIEKKYPDNRFGKGIYADTLDYLDYGGRPKMIMCEGRIDTVEAIQRHPVIRSEYVFKPSFYYSFYTGETLGAMHLRRHSFFERR
jgi:hypothetical protein